MPSPLYPPRLSAATSGLLVVDVQEKLLPAVLGPQRLVGNVAFLLDAAKLLGVPALATEQYPRGLGPTVPELAGRLTAERPTKTAFSGAGVPAVAEGFPPQVLLAGMETHVCVLQTGLDLLARGREVWVAVDAVSGRFRIDHDLALRRLERAGAVLTTCETAVFEWLGDAAHPRFKELSRLIQDRARHLPPSEREAHA
jgi:nicotinamidase-related amidase